MTLTATPTVSSDFTGWSGEGCTGTGTCVVTLDQARSVTATFTLKTPTLTVSKTGTGTGSVSSSPAGITCGATCANTFDYGTSVTLTATPATGSTFTGWSGGGCSGTGTCVVSVTAATSVTAQFTLQTFSLTVSKAGTGTGSVTSSPGRDHLRSDLRELVQLRHGGHPDGDADGELGLQRVVGCGCTGTGTCVVTVDSRAVGDGHVRPRRPATSWTVSKTGTGTGSVDLEPGRDRLRATCSNAFDYGTVVTLTATPATGSTFTGWSGGGCSGTGTCVVSVTAATSVTATVHPADLPPERVQDRHRIGFGVLQPGRDHLRSDVRQLLQLRHGRDTDRHARR